MPAKKATAKKSTTKKPAKKAVKKSPAKKATAKKPTTKKAAAKKAPAKKKVVKKAAPKKAAVKKSTVKKSPVKKATPKKAATKKPAAKKVAPKKTVTKKAPAKKPAAKKVAPKTISKTVKKEKKPVLKPKKIKKVKYFKSPDYIETQEQLLKMHPDDYMNSAQLDFFRRLLISVKARTEQHIDEVRQELREEEHNADSNDIASLEEARALKLRIVDRETKLIPKILLALRRIEDGSYGYCEETGEEIGVPRLLLRPTATLSIDSKSFQEEKEKQFFD